MASSSSVVPSSSVPHLNTVSLVVVGEPAEDIRDVINDVEMLLENNEELEKKMMSLAKRRNENSKKIVDLMKKVKENSQSNVVEVMAETGAFVDSPVVQEFEENLDSLDEEEKFLVQRIQESTRNLLDHEKLLLDLENQGGQDENWNDQFDNVQKFRILHKKYKDSKEIRLEIIQQEIERISREMKVVAKTCRGGRRKVLKEKFVIRQAATSISTPPGPGHSKSRFSINRKLNESVVDCGEIFKKISAKEKEAIVPKLIKIEEISPPNPYKCNVCSQGFTSAAPLVIHLEKHYRSEKVDCPFHSCFFSGTQEVLTNHVRSKHTKELLFICASCPMKFMTMSAKLSHEKKHSQPAWAQCARPGCLRFYQVAKWGCRCSSKK